MKKCHLKELELNNYTHYVSRLCEHCGTILIDKDETIKWQSEIIEDLKSYLDKIPNFIKYIFKI